MTTSNDVIILGGGIIGCALAEELARSAKRRVLIVERDALGQEASSAAAGMLSAQMEFQRYSPIAELGLISRDMYSRWVAHLQQSSGISVGYNVDGLLHLAMDAQEERRIHRQTRWQPKRGLPLEHLSRSQVRRQEPAIDGPVHSAWLFPLEAQVDNGLLMRALTAACRRRGVRILEQTPAHRVIVRKRTVQGVETNRGVFRAPIVVNCLGSWASLGGRFPVKLPIHPIRGQMLAFQAPRRLFRRMIVSRQAYVVQRRDGRLICGSTMESAGFVKALTFEGMRNILSGIQQFSRSIDESPLLQTWSGLRPVTPDQQPILGTTSVEGLFIATGHFRHGILLAPITAKLMAQLILTGHSSIDLGPFSIQRFSSP